MAYSPGTGAPDGFGTCCAASLSVVSPSNPTTSAQHCPATPNASQRFRRGSRATGRVPSRPEAGLCRDCALLDLETHMARAHNMYEGARRQLNGRTLVCCRARGAVSPAYLRDFYFVASLGGRLAEDRACKLCRFLRRHARDPAADTFKLLAICSSEASQFEPIRALDRRRRIKRPWTEVEHNVFLAVVPDRPGIPRTGLPLRWLESTLPQTGGIYRLTEDSEEEQATRLTLPRDVGPDADLELAGYWLHTCSAHHGARCAPKKPPGAALPGFRAVNCAEDPVRVERVPWSERYVALSYVWGPNTQTWPQTIRDAVVVTRKLGYEYLWVDRLCIDQSDPDEKMRLIARMDDIYQGADFTIINAAGDAGTGLPGVQDAPRSGQPRVELGPSVVAAAGAPRGEEQDEYLELLNVPASEYAREVADHDSWLDSYRHGLPPGGVVRLDVNRLTAERARRDRYGITQDDMDFWEDTAEQWGMPIGDLLEKQQELARRLGIPLNGLVPYLGREAAKKAGRPIPDDQPVPPPTRPPMVDPRKRVRPLPAGAEPGKSVLVSTMRDPREAIRASEWATRGWTYQEGVLSRRCLVFTPEQMYWECRGMAVAESVQLPIPALHTYSEPDAAWVFADFMLSGVFRGDRHRVPELQYGFRRHHDQDDSGNDDAEAQCKALDGHIAAFTSRRLTDPGDAWNAFLGVAARYVAGRPGLALFLGILYWAGPLTDGQPGLHHSFALSVSVWYHVGRSRGPGVRAADCPRRRPFPSWSWVGWEGRAELNGDDYPGGGTGSEEEDGSPPHTDADDDTNAHADFFAVMTSPAWRTGLDRLWAADMLLHSADGRASAPLRDGTTLHHLLPDAQHLRGTTWLLTIRQPLVLRQLTPTPSHGPRRLLGLPVDLRLSVPLTEDELAAGHRAGRLAAVLVFAGAVPYRSCDGRARFLLVRRAGARWERIGRLVLTLDGGRVAGCAAARDMLDLLPIRPLGTDVTIA
ncbi:hypothetical protein CDD83_6386 [Cordyceps sp. RAO-2017]|nr:hypothetical protein CDD83_6386 [Cordyceps sp. RAO-2017]